MSDEELLRRAKESLQDMMDMVVEKDAELTRLREEYARVMDDNASLRAEGDRLREALEKIESNPMLGVIPLKNIARNALKETSMVDELLAERKAEARRENDE